jgi:hypothetical protein
MVNLFQNNSIRQKRYQELSSIFIKIAPENPVLWTGMKGAFAESRKNKSDAETSSA